MAFNILLLFCLLFSPLFASQEDTPWGKDADLIKEKKIVAKSSNSLAGADTLITFHQKVLSPADGPRSHYYPSSSEYMRKAMQKHGCLTGFFLGCDRLMRENNDPWLYPLLVTKNGDYLRYDPVPE